MKKLILLAMLTTMPVLAGQEGNGGDVVVCNGEVKLLDYVEAKHTGYEINLEGSSLNEKVFSTIDNITDNFKGLKSILRSYAQELLDDMEIFLANKNLKNEELNKLLTHIQFTDGLLIDINDSAHKSLPVGCVDLQQVAIHQEPKNFMKRRYEMKSDLIKRMDLDNIAGLILHESLYRYSSTRLNHTNSVNSRTLNAYLASNMILNEQSLDIQFDRLSSLSFIESSCDARMKIDNLEFYPIFPDFGFSNSENFYVKGCSGSIFMIGDLKVFTQEEQQITVNNGIVTQFTPKAGAVKVKNYYLANFNFNLVDDKYIGKAVFNAVGSTDSAVCSRITKWLNFYYDYDSYQKVPTEYPLSGQSAFFRVEVSIDGKIAANDTEYIKFDSEYYAKTLMINTGGVAGYFKIRSSDANIIFMTRYLQYNQSGEIVFNKAVLTPIVNKTVKYSIGDSIVKIKNSKQYFVTMDEDLSIVEISKK